MDDLIKHDLHGLDHLGNGSEVFASGKSSRWGWLAVAWVTFFGFGWIVLGLAGLFVYGLWVHTWLSLSLSGIMAIVVLFAVYSERGPFWRARRIIGNVVVYTVGAASIAAIFIGLAVAWIRAIARSF